MQKISVFPRTSNKKSDPKKNRREGEVPGVIYGLNKANHNICVKLEEIQAILRKIPQGLLPTTVFELQEGDKTHKALVKEIQYHHATYAIQHIDFALLADDRMVTINVPIQVEGMADCVGIKLGGFLRHIIRSFKVKCLPQNIPSFFTIDVRALDITHSKTLGDIQMPEGVRPMVKLNEVAVVIAKRV